MSHLPPRSAFTTLCSDALPSELWAAVQGLLGENGALAADKAQLAAENGKLKARLAELEAKLSRPAKGQPIAEAIIAAFAERHALLPAADTLDRIGRVGRAVARKHMEVALLDGFTSEGLARLDGLLVVDPSPTSMVTSTSSPWAPPRKNRSMCLDGLYGHESRIDIDEHYVDTGGASDYLFSLFAIGGNMLLFIGKEP